ncbi:MAG: hypothetical protein JWO36_1814, partial [Myxococcales bacterium]|nr:hypothetical protein [Myxococcales bacterium]
MNLGVPPTTVRVVVDNAPTWLQYAVAFGTVGAAVFAGWAALVARRSAQAAMRLVTVETERDARERGQAFRRQAQRVSVDVAMASHEPAGGRQALDVLMAVMNASADPVLKVRVKIAVGDTVWGPQLIGTIAPGSRIVAIARLFAPPE